MKKYTISNDPDLYEAWPDLALAPNGKLVCIFSECTHHTDRTHTRIMLSDSEDEGKTWSSKRAITESCENKDYYYNCARIGTLSDKRMFAMIDKMPRSVPAGKEENYLTQHSENFILFSEDSGVTWSSPLKTPLKGIVPDRLLELGNGRWIISAHRYEDQFLTQYLHYSDDKGETWSEEITVAKEKGLNLCETSILPIDDNTLVAFLRENSSDGHPCFKTISKDGGVTWGPCIPFPLPGCHRPVARMLKDQSILITFRMFQGGVEHGFVIGLQNFMGCITNIDSVLSENPKRCVTRIFPIDYDRAKIPDTGYSGHVELNNGDIYMVNYIVDDAINLGQIRGYRIARNDIILEEK